VTGATGLVGAWLVGALADKGARVAALIHHPDPQSEFYRSGVFRKVAVIQGNLEDYSVLEHAINKYETEVVFHLGAQAIVGVAQRAPLQTFEANIRGTYNLLEACRRLSGLVARIIVASSDKAYGEQAVLPYTEDMPLLGRYPYEVSKSCADLICQSYFQTYGLPVGIARCGNVYGGGDLNWSRIVPEAIRAALLGLPLTIRSDGTYVRDYIYVKDVIAAYLLLAERLDQPPVTGQAFNFSPWQPMTVTDLVQAILKLVGRPAAEIRIVNSATGEIHSQYLDSGKARRLLDWQPRFTLEEGLRETIQWYESYLASGGK
jgi:CDP-glucose 4,6-dehydratase